MGRDLFAADAPPQGGRDLFAATPAQPERNRLAETGAGALRGVMGIGNTIIDAATYLPSKAIPALEEFRDWRRGGTAQMDQQHKDSNFYAGGKLAAELAGTAGAGGLIAKGARAIPAAAAAAPNLIRAIETSGFVGGGLPTRAAGGAIAGAGSTALADPQSAGAGAAIGGALPVVGKAAGALGSKVAGMLPEKAAGNPMTLQAARDASKAGLVIPPSDVQPQGLVMEAMGGLSGKIKTAQRAAEKNQPVINDMVRKDLGLSGKGPITGAEIKAAKQAQFDVYDAARKISPDADEAVDFWRQANFEARKQGAYYARSANPAAGDVAAAARQEAEQWAKVIEEEATKAGNKGLAAQLADARVSLGKIGTIERARNKVTGDVMAPKLGAMFDKGQPLSGGMQEVAKAQQAFPRAMQHLKESPKAVSPLDWGMAVGSTAMTQNPLALALLGARPMAREMLLSRGGQARAMRDISPSALAQALSSQSAYRLAPQLGQEGFDQ